MPSKRNAAAAASANSSAALTSATPGKAASPGAASTSTAASAQKSFTPNRSSVQSPLEIINSVMDRYFAETPQRVKLIDAFMAFLMVLGAVQFVYVVLAGNYPFNAFLSGFSATVGQFVLTASLRMQTNPENRKGNFETISDERAFADFVFGSLILHLFCVNFIN